jgi:hypothetical protein
MDLAGLLSLFGCSERVMRRWRREDDWVVGLDEQDQEIVRVPLREPVRIRGQYDEKYQVARVNCP